MLRINQGGLRPTEGKKMIEFNGVKVFTATKARERAKLGEDVTQWILEAGKIVIVDKIVTQSSDSEFHCLTITLFYQYEV